MNADGLKQLFEPFVAVEIKRMFGGAGVCAEEAAGGYNITQTRNDKIALATSLTAPTAEPA